MEHSFGGEMIDPPALAFEMQLGYFLPGTEAFKFYAASKSLIL
jgi:hypothetical protein